MGFSLLVASRGYSLVMVHSFLIAMASLVSEACKLSVLRLLKLGQVDSVVVVPGLQSTGSIVVAHGLSCSAAYGIFTDQGLNPCLLHLQADSLPLSQQGRLFYSLNGIFHLVDLPIVSQEMSVLLLVHLL